MNFSPSAVPSTNIEMGIFGEKKNLNIDPAKDISYVRQDLKLYDYKPSYTYKPPAVKKDKRRGSITKNKINKTILELNQP